MINKNNFDMEKFTDYVATYGPYTDSEVAFEDMLYFLGVSTDDQYEFAKGFEVFKEELAEEILYEQNERTNTESSEMG